MTGEIRRTDLLLALFQEVRDPQRREARVARTAGGGQGDMDALAGEFRPRLQRGQQRRLDLPSPVRLVADHQFGREHILA